MEIGQNDHRENAPHFIIKAEQFQIWSLVASESAKCNFDYFYMAQGMAYCKLFHMAGKGCRHILRNLSNTDQQSHNQGCHCSYGILEQALKYHFK